MKYSKEEKLNLSNKIKSVIAKGVYNQFPKLKDHLSYIADKLFRSAYVVNDSLELSINERKVLTELEFIPKLYNYEYSYYNE